MNDGILTPGLTQMILDLYSTALFFTQIFGVIHR